MDSESEADTLTVRATDTGRARSWSRVMVTGPPIAVMLMVVDWPERREIAMQQLAAMQLAQYLQDARDLPAGRGFGPALAAAFQKRAQVAMLRVLEREAIQDRCARLCHRERVEDAYCPWVSVQHLAEVGFTQPAVDVWAHLETELFGDDRRASGAPDQVHLTVSARAQPVLDLVAQTRFRADDDLAGDQEMTWRAARPVDGVRTPGRRVVREDPAALGH